MVLRHVKNCFANLNVIGALNVEIIKIISYVLTLPLMTITICGSMKFYQEMHAMQPIILHGDILKIGNETV